jgi:hypothetical protein
MYSRKFLRLEHEPLSDLSFEVDLTMRRLPDFGIASVRISPLRVGRTRELISDGNDGLTFQLSSTAGLARQLGREIEVEAGQAVAMSNADVGTFDFPLASRVLALSLSRGKLAALVRNLEDTLVRAVPNDNQAVALLKGYIGALDDLAANATPELTELVVAHLYDLAALALGAAGAAAAVACGRGVRAARLVAARLSCAATCIIPICAPTAWPRTSGSRRATCTCCSSRTAGRSWNTFWRSGLRVRTAC